MRRSYLKIRLRHPAEGIPLSPSDGPKFKKGDIVEAKQAGGDAYILAKIVSVDAAARTYGISYSDRTKGTDVAEADIREATAEQKVTLRCVLSSARSQCLFVVEMLCSRCNKHTET
jgi:hypothetical protein